jgi:hypothetical protein
MSRPPFSGPIETDAPRRHFAGQAVVGVILALLSSGASVKMTVGVTTLSFWLKPEVRSCKRFALQAGLNSVVPVAGLEPATVRLVGGCSSGLGLVVTLASLTELTPFSI